MPWNVAVDQRPAAVAVPTTVTQVVELTRVAARLGLRVSAQSTGHAAAPLAAHGMTDTVLVRTGALSGVHVDPVRRVARVEAGARWGDVVAAAAPYGLTALGELVSANSIDDPELLWALRGGGGSFGLVTTIEIELHDVGQPCAGMMLWDVSRAEEVLRTWAAWWRTRWRPGRPAAPSST